MKSIRLSKKNEKDLFEEFEKVIKNPSMEESLSHILKLSNKKEII